MNVQVLIATMNQKDDQLLYKMNIQTDAIVGNQCDRNEVIQQEFRGHSVTWLSFQEKGVGLNRNNALMRSNADICILADDDVTLEDGYEELICSAFQDCPDADVLVLNTIADHRFQNKKITRIHRFNYQRYGAARLAFRRRTVSMAGIYFNQNFGGGTQYGSGEDTLFLKACLDKKLKIYGVPTAIARISNERPSTWFSGYDEKFFHSKGVLFSCLNPRLYKLMILAHCVKNRKKYKDYGLMHAYCSMLDGVKGERNLR